MLRGDKVREMRKKRDLTQTELGAMVNLSQQHLTEYELDKHPNVSLRMVLRLCDALGCDIEDIIDYTY